MSPSPCLFQILVAVPRNDDRVSVSAKTLSGFGYRGHVFRDTEIFWLAFPTHTQPALARNLPNYRHHTLPGARRRASEAGYKGATYKVAIGSASKNARTVLERLNISGWMDPSRMVTV
ncbi:MAG TPA: hypothetical protein VM366_20225 [Anaerolineae bacterium]|nr:hypothetical protein [Anaerolineae bacterium]